MPFRDTTVNRQVIEVFGDVAVGFVVCEIAENEVEVNRSVEALLLIKDEGRWRIVSQAWDTTSESKADSRGSHRWQAQA